MNLISCDYCGVVLDKDKLVFPDIWDDETGEKKPNAGVWHNDSFSSCVPCPVCENAIVEDQT